MITLKIVIKEENSGICTISVNAGVDEPTALEFVALERECDAGFERHSKALKHCASTALKKFRDSQKS